MTMKENMTTRQVTQFYIYFLNLRSDFVAFNFVLESSQNSFQFIKANTNSVESTYSAKDGILDKSYRPFK